MIKVGGCARDALCFVEEVGGRSGGLKEMEGVPE